MVFMCVMQVFYEALDAVIFCLQTQQALNRQTWPDGLFKDLSTHPIPRKKTSESWAAGAAGGAASPRH